MHHKAHERHPYKQEKENIGEIIEEYEVHFKKSKCLYLVPFPSKKNGTEESGLMKIRGRYADRTHWQG
jgi:hypothetical protein